MTGSIAEGGLDTNLVNVATFPVTEPNEAMSLPSKLILLPVVVILGVLICVVKVPVTAVNEVDDRVGIVPVITFAELMLRLVAFNVVAITVSLVKRVEVRVGIVPVTVVRSLVVKVLVPNVVKEPEIDVNELE